MFNFQAIKQGFCSFKFVREVLHMVNVLGENIMIVMVHFMCQFGWATEIHL